jgi:hypothetical protein
MTTQAPLPEYSGGTGGGDAASKVSLPGMLLIIVGALNLLSILYWVLNTVLGFTIANTSSGGALVGGAMNFVWAIVALVIGALNILGGMKMRQLRSYGLAMTGAVTAMLPCTCCCPAGLGAGIFALVVLMNADVKAAFR